MLPQRLLLPVRRRVKKLFDDLAPSNIFGEKDPVAAVLAQRELFDMIKSREASCYDGRPLPYGGIKYSILTYASPLALSALYDHPDLFDTILEYEPDAVKVCDSNGDTLLMTLADNDEDLKYIPRLVKLIPINATNKNGDTALKKALEGGNREAALFYLNHGANGMIRNRFNVCARDVVADGYLHDPRIVKIIDRMEEQRRKKRVYMVMDPAITIKLAETRQRVHLN